MYLSAKSLKKISIFLIGCGFVFAGIIQIISIASFSPFDPSFNNAVSYDEVYNITGKIGSFLSDSVIQLFGFSGLFFGIVFASWGLALIRNKQNNWWILKVLCFSFLIFAVSAFLTILPVPENYIMVSGGGWFGHLIHTYLTSFVDNITFYLITGFATFVFFITASGIKFKQVLKCVLFLFSFIRIIFAKMFFSKNTKSLNETIYNEENIIELPEEIHNFEIIGAKEKTKLSHNIVKRRKTETPKATVSNVKNNYLLPKIDFLSKAVQASVKVSSSYLQEQVHLLEQVLQDFGIKGQIIQVKPGPVVTLYELEPAAGTKSSRIIGLADDIARSMSAMSARIAVIPGKNLIGIELPNNTRETVYLRELVESNSFKDSTVKLPIALGKNIGGESVIVDLSKMPHLLVAGTTGSGKSVSVNTMILSFLYKLSPEECKFIMIDPKMLELSVYDGIPHLLAPVVTEPGKAVVALKWVVKEMENRYRLMSNVGVRNIAGYNEKVQEATRENKVLTRNVQTGFDTETGKPIFETIEIENKPLPYIVVIVDEMADLMLVAGKDIEASIQRLAQMARAAGIHLIMATQRPSVDVITGVIKANFPTRISFQVTSKIDSRTILGEQGAEQLLGMGDMLYMSGGGKIVRVHAPFVSDNEVEKVVTYLKSQSSPTYIEDITKAEEEDEEGSNFSMDSGDKLYDEAVAIVIRDKKASTSYIQRCLKIGYNRAATIIERMEKEGIISAANHVGKREILIQDGR
ncbi:MAG: DNA translocase FtsK 4TM domain-containing protein [Sphingobacteriia bacterium]|nr:DNA translocase FtsK 4TM domain-containing protein [Sphingobacteriia bacterium]